MPRSLILAVACTLPACSLLAPSDGELSSQYGKPSSATDASADSSSLDAGADSSNPDAGDADACNGAKLCDGQCVALDDPAYGCAENTCAPCDLSRAVATCEAAECRIAQCVAGYLDVNRADADGCELTSPIPTDGLILWLAADQGVEENSGKVAAWRDRSPRRHDHTQANLPFRPTLLPNQLNGKPAVEFQSQRLESTPFVANLDSGFSLFAILQRNASTNPDHEWGGILDLFDNDYTNGLYFARLAATNDFTASYAMNPATLVTTAGAFSAGAPHRFGLVLGPSALSFRWDGQVPMFNATAFTPQPMKIERSHLGSTSTTAKYHSGWIAEIVLYERAVANPIVLEEYLQNKWGCCP